jgi:hypothetical protein
MIVVAVMGQQIVDFENELRNLMGHVELVEVGQQLAENGRKKAFGNGHAFGGWRIGIDVDELEDLNGKMGQAVVGQDRETEMMVVG